MKRLYLLRHAKSSWSEPELADFERPLNQRGLNAAPFIGKLIAARQMVPDLTVSSPACRAAETARLVHEASSAPGEIEFVDRIYEASPQTLLQVTAGLNDKAGSAMIVGHNPGMEGFLRLLTGRSEAMPTAALAIIDLAVRNWSDIKPGCGTLIEVVRPKEHMPE
ncbi:MAG TPA: histidine phosphatase family protein [Pyrinomonadaceae bacterium]|jgi:phosphohistidine phosphatase|nr:histidine phosphatase family protein [Pyrinomonadaceae bacterium]